MDASLLELVVGGLPYPHGAASGEWRVRHAIRPEGVTELDHQVVADFVGYERAHGRTVGVLADPALSDWASWRPPPMRPRPGAHAMQCCTHAYHEGCGAELVCHGAPATVAAEILAQRVLRSAAVTTGRHPGDLAEHSTWGEPPDYFEYVMLANGKCTAPEAVALSRVVGRDLVPSDLAAGYRPAVRFYFEWDALATRPDAAFDGVHPVKIRGELPLDDLVVAVVVHAREHDVIATAQSGPLRDRLVVVDATDPRPDEWATAALAVAETLA